MAVTSFLLSEGARVDIRAAGGRGLVHGAVESGRDGSATLCFECYSNSLKGED